MLARGCCGFTRVERVVDVVLTGEGAGGRGLAAERQWWVVGRGGGGGGGAGKDGFWAWGLQWERGRGERVQGEGRSKQKVATLNQKSVLCIKKRLTISHVLTSFSAAFNCWLLSSFDSCDSSSQPRNLLCGCALVQTSPDYTASKLLKQQQSPIFETCGRADGKGLSEKNGAQW